MVFGPENYLVIINTSKKKKKRIAFHYTEMYTSSIVLYIIPIHKKMHTRACIPTARLALYFPSFSIACLITPIIALL